MMELVDGNKVPSLDYSRWAKARDREGNKDISPLPFGPRLDSTGPSGSLYSPLPPGSHIRLLELLPSALSGDRLESRLHVYHIQEVKQCYEALSYTWESWWTDRAPGTIAGDTSNRFMICSGIHTNIGPNLAAALRRLRNDTTSKNPLG
jgi:hypothetical protein